MDKNIVQYGLENVHYAKMKKAVDGSITYEKPVHVPGAVNLNLDAEGEQAKLAADNIAAYFSSFANNGYSGELEIVKVPEQFKIDILGEKRDKKTGGLLEVANNAPTSPFALFYQIEGDISGTRYVYYNTTVSRPSNASATTAGSIEPKTTSMKITTAPRTSDKRVRFSLSLDELNAQNKETYEKFFETVYEVTEFDEGKPTEPETPTEPAEI